MNEHKFSSARKLHRHSIFVNVVSFKFGQHFIVVKVINVNFGKFQNGKSYKDLLVLQQIWLGQLDHGEVLVDSFKHLTAWLCC